MVRGEREKGGGGGGGVGALMEEERALSTLKAQPCHCLGVIDYLLFVDFSLIFFFCPSGLTDYYI